MKKILNHPLINIKLTILRDKTTNHIAFKKTLKEITSLMTYEVFKKYKGKTKKVKTPTGSIAQGLTFDKEIVVVPILRAGLGMVEGVEYILPQVKVGHIGQFRDEKTFKAKEYFYKMPKVSKQSIIFVLDPMIATAGSAIQTINKLKLDGYKNIVMLSLLGSREGVDNFEKAHSDVMLFISSIDENLNKNKFIVPGLGDAGDRIFGTK